MSSKTRSQLPLSLQGYVSSVLLTAFAVHAVCLAIGVRIATCHAATLPEESQLLEEIPVSVEAFSQSNPKLEMQVLC